MTEKFDNNKICYLNNNKICYLGCLIHAIDRASIDICDAFEQDTVCDYLTKEEVDKLNEADKLINQVLTSTMGRATALGINPDH